MRRENPPMILDKIAAIVIVILITIIGVNEYNYSERQKAERQKEHLKRVGMVKVIQNQRSKSIWECGDEANQAVLEHTVTKYRFTSCGHYGEKGDVFLYE